MSAKVGTVMGDEEDFSGGIFLHDIKEIGKALYVHNNKPKALNASCDRQTNAAARSSVTRSDSKLVVQDSPCKNRKSSIWKWKLLKALCHIPNQRFSCCFFLHAHAIEGLPSNFNNLNLCLTWKRKGDMVSTRPVRARGEGVCEFEETLMHRCTVYARRIDAQSSVKYEPKLFLLRVSVIEAPELEIGKHWIDLTRLLPLTLEELEREKRSSRKWTTSFKLTGIAKGALLHVSFGFCQQDDNSFEPGYFVKVPDVVRVSEPFLESHFDDLSRISMTSHNKRVLDTVPSSLTETSQTNTSLSPKLDEEKMSNDVHERDDSTEFTVTEKGVEISLRDSFRRGKHGSQRFESSLIETIDAAEFFEAKESIFDEYSEPKTELHESWHEESERAVDEDNSTSVKEQACQELDSVSSEMLLPSSAELDSLPNISNSNEQEPYPPTKPILKSNILDEVAESVENEFLKMLSIEQTPASSFSDYRNVSATDTLASLFEENTIAWENHIPITDVSDVSLALQTVETNHVSLTKLIKSKRNAKMLENLETQSLMHQWGLDENAFQITPCYSSGGFGSPVYFPEEEPLKLPNLGEGLGPVIQTKDGGFLRSMNPLLFVKAKNGARLILQVSAPGVLPAALGFSATDILKLWAAGGAEKMHSQAKESMPLEDITRKTLKQAASEAESASKRRGSHNECSALDDMESEFVSFENLVPTAMTNIEGLLIEGLKIQSGMPDQEAPSRIRTSGIPLQDVDKLVKYFMSLEDYLKLDSGDFDAKDLKIGQQIKENQAARVFSNSFTMALNVQLRNPLRDYEAVGSSMLALVRVERKHNKKFPRFKIMEVHLAGFVGNRHLWGTSRQNQSGLRWLFSSNMATTKKHSIFNSNALTRSSPRMRKACPGDVLWSISSSTQCEATEWDESVALNVHKRNPDITFPNESPGYK